MISFLKSLLSSSTSNTRKQAQQLLRDNSEDDAYTVPTRVLYPFQWNWDSCFTALGWVTFDEDRAWAEIASLLKGQCRSGKIPHIIFHKDSESYFPGPDIWQYDNPEMTTSGISQPPVLATTVRMAYERCKNKEQALGFINSIMPQIFAYHRWWHERRDPHNTGLVATYHPWETGRDNSVEWDEPLKAVPLDDLQPYVRKDLATINPAYRPTNEDYDYYVALLQLFKTHKYDQVKLYEISPFKVADIGINSILARANSDLLYMMTLCDSSEEDRQTVLNWLDMQAKAFERFWNSDRGVYQSINLITGEKLDFVTSGSFLSLWSGLIPFENASVMASTLENMRHTTKVLVPSLRADDAKYDRYRYWRGPVWAIINFMIYDGLKIYDQKLLADQIFNTTRTAIKTYGFKEYYDPVSGEGLGGDNFSWTAAMWLYWLDKK